MGRLAAITTTMVDFVATHGPDDLRSILMLEFLCNQDLMQGGVVNMALYAETEPDVRRAMASLERVDVKYPDGTRSRMFEFGTPATGSGNPYTIAIGRIALFDATGVDSVFPSAALEPSDA